MNKQQELTPFINRALIKFVEPNFVQQLERLIYGRSPILTKSKLANSATRRE